MQHLRQTPRIFNIRNCYKIYRNYTTEVHNDNSAKDSKVKILVADIEKYQLKINEIEEQLVNVKKAGNYTFWYTFICIVFFSIWCEEQNRSIRRLNSQLITNTSQIRNIRNSVDEFQKPPNPEIAKC